MHVTLQEKHLHVDRGASLKIAVKSWNVYKINHDAMDLYALASLAKEYLLILGTKFQKDSFQKSSSKFGSCPSEVIGALLAPS